MVLDFIIKYIADLIRVAFGGYKAQMTTLALYTIGIAIYGIVIWNYYHHLARRDIFKIDFSKYRYETEHVGVKKFFDLLFYILKYLIIFPFFSFLWFAMLGLLLFFLAKTQTVENILLISITIVSAVRITAYYKEDLSKDIAKMIPFALLGVFVVDPSFFSIDIIWERFATLPEFTELIGKYLLFVVLLEFGLRMSVGLVKLFKILTKEIEAPPKP